MSNLYTNYFEGSRISDGWQEHLNRGSSGGIDYAVKVGTAIKAPTDGMISNIPNNGSGGHTVNLVHANGWKTQFMHLSRFVGEGKVKQGDVIGYTGGAKGSDGAGSSTGPHCHTHLISSGGSRVNPLNYIGQDFSGSLTSSNGGSSWSYSAPKNKDVATEIQQRLNTLGFYTGSIDGVFGPLTAKGVQTVIKNAGFYNGSIDGVPGPMTCKGIQEFGKKNGNYAPPGTIDLQVGPLSWAGFLQTLREDMDAQAKTVLAAQAKAESEKALAAEQRKAKAAEERKAKAVLAAQAKSSKSIKEAEMTNKKETYTPLAIPSEVAASSNNLGVIITNPKTRKIAYSIYVAISFLVTNTIVAYSSIEAPIPVWLKVATAIVGNSAIAFGGLAIANIDSSKK